MAPQETQDLAKLLRVHYVYDETIGLPVMRDGIVRVGREEHLPKVSGEPTAVVRTVHPLVFVHPDTGDHSLHVSCGNIDFMEAPADGDLPAVHLNTKQSYELVERFLAASVKPPFLYKVDWQPGDFVVWDNRLTLHSAPERDETIGQRLSQPRAAA